MFSLSPYEAVTRKMGKNILDLQSTDVIKHWGLAGDTEHDNFEYGLEPESRHAGKNCAYLKSLADEAYSEEIENACGRLIQRCAVPLKYEGRRLRMYAWVKSALVGRSICRLELDIIGKWGWYCKWNGTYDNMSDRPITGVTEWQCYELVVDVPEDCRSMYFGLFMVGVGKVWLDEVSFEEVDKSVPLTGIIEGPSNLNFTD